MNIKYHDQNYFLNCVYNLSVSMDFQSSGIILLNIQDVTCHHDLV